MRRKALDSTMGRILTTITVTNRIDQANASRQLIPNHQIRSVTLDRVLVDTGATTLCLPSHIIIQLGLELLKEVDVETATGISKARIFQDAKLSILGREGTFECLELPGGKDPLLGVIPLESLGIELDLQNQELVLLPISPTQTYLTILLLGLP
jgi:clan AA aspartic protease